MKIAIYINNYSIAEVDCSDLTKGNPGIGGTEYCILLLAQLYKQYYPEHEVFLFANKTGNLPKVDLGIVTQDLDTILKKFVEVGADILVISAVNCGMPLPDAFFDSITERKIKTVIWGHNYYLSDFCDKLAKSPYVKANVFVGRQQYDRYIDHKLIHKSTCIYNMYPLKDKPGRKALTNHSVTYIGSLVPTKGFHILASSWKRVLQQVPDATLNVIGSGKLYDRDSKLGKYGIAEEKYENKFMSGLLDEKGNILPSVHFFGVMGAEKDDVISETAVGIVNPIGRTETFGISALDFESLGVPVVTIAKGGFLDTVLHHKTGLLYKSKKKIAQNITALLRDTESNITYGKNGREFAKQFEPEKIICEWASLLKTVQEDGKIAYIKPDNFFSNNLKWARFANRAIKNTLKVEYHISVIGVETLARNALRRLEK